MGHKGIGPLKLMFTRPKERIGLLLSSANVPCEVTFPDGKVEKFGKGRPLFRLVFHSWSTLRRLVDEFSFARAYVEGEFEIEGDILKMFDVRGALRDSAQVSGILRFWTHLLFRSATALNRYAIDWHYNFSDAFYHTFIDTEHHFYSHGIYHSDNETLEQASTHKLEQMFEELELKPGMHLLDIGGGWGPVPRYCCPRGVEVTSLTIADDSYAYISKMIKKNKFNARVLKEDFLEHTPAKPYDAVVIYGVIEHIPRYRRFFKRTWQSLKPDGLFYLDASAALQKYDTSNFTKHYIWRGTHAFMCLQDVIQEMLFNGFDVLKVKNETRDYELTMLEWARRFEANKDKIIEKWGAPLYRAFRIYLWGGCYAMKTHELQAYHVLARRAPEPGPQPSNLRRFKNFAASLK